MAAPSPHRHLIVLILVLLVGAAGVAVLSPGRTPVGPPPNEPQPQPQDFKPRKPIDPTGYNLVTANIDPWPPDAPLERIAESWRGAAARMLVPVDESLARSNLPPEQRVSKLLDKAGLLHYDGEAEKAYAVLEEARAAAGRSPAVEAEWLYTIVYLQGLTALRRGETENCVMCRGESSCILPLAPSARHTNQAGSRLAIKHFTEYLERFPDDLSVRWLLNVAHMTLAEYPDRVDARFRLSLDRYNHNEHGIGRFRDVGHLVGMNRLNMAGAAVLDDLDSDGRLDVMFTSLDPTQPMAFYRNKGDGTFEDRTNEAGLLDQLGGLGCVQGDYNNDGFPDVFVMRGAWLRKPMRPTLLRNNGNGTFTDVTKKAGLIHPMNTDTAQWADFDNDGHLDLFVCGEAQPSRLYRNKGDETFEEVAEKAGLGNLPGMWKGCSWFDYDNDAFPDLFLNNYTGKPRLFHNNRNGTFTDTTDATGIAGPKTGLSCWTWDYDNDGWPDVFATSYDRTLDDQIKGLLGQPHARETSRLYRNLGGKKFMDVTTEAGLDACFSAMGTNFGDFDNDGFLDCYLGTGDHDIATLVPNRMFRNLGGKRFADVTSSSGTGHLQKGHGVGIGDWDRNGTADVVVQMGGAIPGDKYHNILFQNPGQGNNWLSVKLVGKKTNRGAIGARVKAVTAGANPQTVYRTVCSGSSFGANPLEQLLGLGKADRVAVLEVYWPTSGTTQTFRDLRAGQAVEITEFEPEFRAREYKPLALPK
jgi:hypothetical protein